MAVRRMLHSDVVSSDRFLSMSFGAQMLYVQITMHADDDGFMNGAEALRRTIGARRADLAVLVQNGYLLQYGSVMVVRHWRMANSLKNDRLKPLSYPEIAEKLYILPNRVYSETPVEGSVNLLSFKAEKCRKRNPSGIPTEEKGKEENRTEEKGMEEEAGGIPHDDCLKPMGGALGKNILLLTEAQTESLLNEMGLECFDEYAKKIVSFLQRGGYVKNHYETMRKWWKEDQKL